jgi:hypothetical protein
MVCGQCGEYPCKRFDKETGGHDSFVLHRRVLPNQSYIRDNGIEAYLALQSERIDFLETVLAKYDDGRSKSFFCIAAALLSVESLNEALHRTADGEELRAVLTAYAEAEGQELRLRK